MSVGTGAAADANAELAPGQMNLLFNAGRVPSALMYAALTEQDVLCRVFGDCLVGDVVDSELRDLIGERGRGPVEPKLFTYVRYTADLGRKGLDALGLAHIRPEEVQKLDAVEAIPRMQEVGQAVAKLKLKPEHFARFAAAGRREGKGDAASRGLGGAAGGPAGRRHPPLPARERRARA